MKAHHVYITAINQRMVILQTGEARTALESGMHNASQGGQPLVACAFITKVQH